MQQRRKAKKFAFRRSPFKPRHPRSIAFDSAQELPET